MSLYPFAGNHAVQSAAFGVEWDTELNDGELAQVALLQNVLAKSLPARNPIEAVVMAVGQSSASPPPRPQTIGYLFSRPGPGGMTRQLEVQRTRCVGQIHDYTRWAPVWQQAHEWFSHVLPIVGSRRISSVGIQYSDVFYWRAPAAQFMAGEVFRRDAEMLPPHVFELQGLWHSNHGYFIDGSEPHPHKLLENVNVAIQDQLQQRSVTISTVHQYHASDMWGWANLKDSIQAIMFKLHARNKDTLKRLLTDKVCDLIALN